MVAVDLGSSAVVVAVAFRREDGKIELKSIVSKPVQGVNAGRIDNIESVSQVLEEALAEAGDRADIRITEAYAGISGSFMRCARHTDFVYVADPQNGVSQSDVASLFDRMRNIQAPDDEVIMEHIPQQYLIDDEQEATNPIGSFGRKLASTFNFLLCLKTPIQRLELALKRVGVHLAGTIPNPLAVADAVLTPDEKEEGVAVIDIGGGVTDVTVYYRNVVRYAASIPIGATAINQDIRTMGVPERYVESLKQQYGSAVAERVSEEKLIRVTGRNSRESRDILLRNLATAIEARAMDIIDYVQEELKISGYADKLAYGLVLTGGSARLKDLDELFRQQTGMEVRVATPEAVLCEESQPLAADPAYATVIGLLLRGRGVAYVPGRDPRPAATPVVPPSVQRPAEPVAPTPPVQPERPAQPASLAASSQPATPVQPDYDEKPAPTPDPYEDEEEQPKKSGGFRAWITKITERFEAPGDDEI